MRCLDNSSRDNAIITSEFSPAHSLTCDASYADGVLTAYYESVTVLG